MTTTEQAAAVLAEALLDARMGVEGRTGAEQRRNTLDGATRIIAALPDDRRQTTIEGLLGYGRGHTVCWNDRDALAAQVAALREALERAARDVHGLSYVTEARSDWATCEKNDCPYYRRILANTADRYTAYGAGEKVVKWPDGSDEWVDTIEGVPVDGSGNRVDAEAERHG